MPLEFEMVISCVAFGGQIRQYEERKGRGTGHDRIVSLDSGMIELVGLGRSHITGYLLIVPGPSFFQILSSPKFSELSILRFLWTS